MQIGLIFFFAVMTAVASQLLLKKGVSQSAIQNFSLANLGGFLMEVLTNRFLLAGLFSYGVSFLLWLMVISRMKLSVAYPITSINFVLVILASHYLFKEDISFFQYGGSLMIIVGVLVLSMGK